MTVEVKHNQGKSPDTDVYVENNMDAAEVVGRTPVNTDLSLITATEDITATNNAEDLHHHQHHPSTPRVNPGEGASKVPISTTKCEYMPTDLGPFTVAVSCKLQAHHDAAGTPSNLGRLHPTAVGSKLARAVFRQSDIRSSGNTKILVSFETASEANSLIRYCQENTDAEWVANPPGANRESQGLLRRVDPDAQESDFLYDAITPGQVNIIAARRLQRRDGMGYWVDCNTWRITFDSPARPPMFPYMEPGMKSSHMSHLWYSALAASSLGIKNLSANQHNIVLSAATRDMINPRGVRHYE